MSEKLIFPHSRPSHTKIVATVGPASDSEEVLAKLITAGVDVFRLNMAHGGTSQAQERLDRIRKVSKKLGVTVGVLADLAGPKMRLGALSNDLYPGDVYQCKTDTPMTFVRGNSTTEPNTFTTTYAPLIDDVNIGDRVMLADGTVVLQVAEKNSDNIVCTVVQGGPVRSRQGVNLPGTKLSIKTLQPADIENARWATASGAQTGAILIVGSGTAEATRATVIMDGGTIRNNNGSTVVNVGTNAFFTMNSGAIQSNHSITNGGGVNLGQATSTFNMNGGTIGGSGTGNSAAGLGGGGVNVNNGVMTMRGGTISHNAATATAGTGGGIRQVGGTVTIVSGTISNNTPNNRN